MTQTRDMPLIVQSDFTVLAEVDHPRFAEARDRLSRFAELIKAPEHVHTYRITPLSVWNACAAGATAAGITADLEAFARFPPPASVLIGVRDFASRYGRLVLTRHDEGSLLLEASDPALAEEMARHPDVRHFFRERVGPTRFLLSPLQRGRLKQALVGVGFPVDDRAGYVAGSPLPIKLRAERRSGGPFALRPYQLAAAEAFHAGGSERGGSGVVVLPCGAGKTMVGMACMAQLQTSTLVLTTSVSAIRQWRDELLDKTSLGEDLIAEYSGERKDIAPVTLATYQVITHRASKDGDYPHFQLFDRQDWGLIIYDEVHVLPAPVFQVTAALQARRRLGLTATLVREDGREGDVFALIGPKKADVPWKTLEAQGWIAKAECTEVRLPLPERLRMPYAVASPKEKFRLASENPDKRPLVKALLERHADEPALVIGVFLDQLQALAGELGAPLVTGTTTQAKRERIFADFRAGRTRVVVVSKVANFALDFPEASVAIQVAGTFGSRQEEAQRLGRILRPKPGRNQAHFYTLVSADTVEQEYALHRQMFLCEQGYAYRIVEDPAALFPAHEIASERSRER
ncbi:MAG: DNA repair helicase [Candidatus Ozemobacter sibiricus]|uniref:DNA 3'-5' helicase n=1 Tax=Candidatus Ozemobacter sibiricus TaxID=2268124 RepID=A0A367Z8R3_9BACT|nr:MAG: DNA repair helicase [Candidatus Ozemobacter sibiricus]